MSFPEHLVPESTEDALPHVAEIMRALWSQIGDEQDHFPEHIKWRYVYGVALNEIARKLTAPQGEPDEIMELYQAERQVDAFERMRGPFHITEDLALFVNAEAASSGRRLADAKKRYGEMFAENAAKEVEAMGQLMRVIHGDALSTHPTLRRLRVAGAVDVFTVLQELPEIQQATARYPFVVEWSAMQAHFCADKFRRSISTTRSAEESQLKYVLSTLPRNSGYARAKKMVEEMFASYYDEAKARRKQAESIRAQVEAAYQ